MKQLPIIFVVVLLGSCAAGMEHETAVINSSTRTVMAGFGTGSTAKYTYTFTPGETKLITPDTYGWKASYLKWHDKETRVYYEFTKSGSGGVFEFKDRPGYTIKVNNTLGETASLDAGGWMEEPMEDIPIGMADDADHTGLVYTKQPVFTVTSNGFPARAFYLVLPNNTIMVTIAW
jgi:outer membrane biogenesis lipoprotein LolB